MKASHKKRAATVGYETVNIRQGQFVFGRKIASKETGLSERSIRTCLKHLQNSGKLTVKPTNKYSIITIVKWGLYQADEACVTSKATSKRPASDQQATTDKNVKNVKNVKNKDWLTPYKLAWEDETCGIIDNGYLARYISPLHKRHGEEKVIKHLRSFLKCVEPKYRSLPKFAESFGDWGKNKVESLYGMPI
jgi:hypothetical protein